MIVIDSPQYIGASHTNSQRPNLSRWLQLILIRLHDHVDDDTFKKVALFKLFIAVEATAMRNSSPSKLPKVATMDGAFFRRRGKE